MDTSRRAMLGYLAAIPLATLAAPLLAHADRDLPMPPRPPAPPGIGGHGDIHAPEPPHPERHFDSDGPGDSGDQVHRSRHARHELNELHERYEHGDITREQYQEQRRELLDRERESD